MGILDDILKRNKTDGVEEDSQKQDTGYSFNKDTLEKLNDILKGTSLQEAESKLGMTLLVLNENVRQKQELLILFNLQVSDALTLYYDYMYSYEVFMVEKTEENYRKMHNKLKKLIGKIVEIKQIVDAIALPYGRGGDEPKFSRAYKYFSRIYVRTLFYPALIRSFIHACNVIISMSQKDKDTTVNTPIIIQKTTPEIPIELLKMLGESGETYRPPDNLDKELNFDELGR